MIELFKAGKKINTISDQGGIIEAIISNIDPVCKFFVEFGAGKNGTQNNTKNLKDNHGYHGLWFDARYPDSKIPIYKEFFTAENVCDIFSRYNVPEMFDVLSIDVDGNDWYILNSILKKYKPSLICIEYNSSMGPKNDCVIRYNPKFVWDGTRYFGASIKAFSILGNKYGYTIVASDCDGIDLFLVKNSEAKKFYKSGDIEAIYRKANYIRSGDGGHPKDTKGRLWERAETILI